MIDDSDYKTILDNFPTSVVIAKKGSSENSFEIIYTNERFTRITQNKVHEGHDVSKLGEEVCEGVNWTELIQRTMNGGISTEKTFYSEKFSIWIQVNVNCVQKKFAAISFSNVSEIKNYETALNEQTKKLENVSHQLFSSQENIDIQLKNIQTLNEQLLFAAYHDSLTNLYNRAWLKINLNLIISEAKKAHEKFSILLFDIDNMKNVNDSRGHEAGDDLLKQSAAILKLLESEQVMTVRSGGDEFILIYKNIKNREEALTKAKKVLTFFNAEDIGISGGISIFPEDSENYEDLLKFADMAKIDAKKNGKNTIEIFHSVMQERFLSKLNMETKLYNAIVSKNFQLYYQPQYDAKTKNLRGFEALLRWRDEDLGWISPDQFIPLAEETFFIIPLGDWVLKTAISALKEWEEKFGFDGVLSVNVSPVQFAQDNFEENFLEKIRDENINPDHLEIEITEGVLINDVKKTIGKLKKIRSYGVGVSLDDFGTGYSSLRYLQILPLTTLKIDKSFIQNISISNGSTDSFEQNLTENIVSLAKKMNLQTIAEGVEDQGQLEVLRIFGCSTIQGFLWGKPMPKDLCEELIQAEMQKRRN